MTTKSTPGSPIRVMRNDSRITRLMRLRSTALPDAFREMAIPKRASPKVFPCASTVNSESLERVLPRKTRENSVGLVSRFRRGRVWEGLMLGRSVRTISPSISGAEPCTALGATAGQNQSAALGCHAGTEPVGARALDYAGLICPFHVAYLISNSKPSAGLSRDVNRQF